MSMKPEITFYTTSATKAVEITWKLKRLAMTHETRQMALMEEFRAKSEKLTEEMQVEQSATFEALRTEMNIPDKAWGDGNSWAVNIKNLASGTVALIHDQDESRQRDDCSCSACQRRRAIAGIIGIDDDDEDEERVVH